MDIDPTAPRVSVLWSQVFVVRLFARSKLRIRSVFDRDHLRMFVFVRTNVAVFHCCDYTKYDDSGVFWFKS